MHTLREFIFNQFSNFRIQAKPGDWYTWRELISIYFQFLRSGPRSELICPYAHIARINFHFISDKQIGARSELIFAYAHIRKTDNTLD